MTAIRHDQPVEPAAISVDVYVLPSHLTEGRAGPGPRFGDDVWDFRPFVPRTTKQARCDFTNMPDEIAVITAKEYLYSRLRRGPSGGQSGRKNDRPMKITNAVPALFKVKLVMRTLRGLGVLRLADVTKEHLAAALAVWMNTSIDSAHAGVNALKQLSAHGPFLSRDRLTVPAWPGRSAKAVVGLRRDRETSTPRIPEHICAPFIKAALFYVDTASADLLAARREIEALQTARDTCERGPGEVEQRLRSFIDQRRAHGQGIPALPLQQAHTRPEAAIVDGVVQAPNQRLITLLAEVGLGIKHHKLLLEEAGAELGYEDGGLATHISIWPESGRPWRTPLDGWSLRLELAHLRTACWIVIAYLSGARDAEVRELGRDCAFTEPGADGRLRHKLRGRVFKGRKATGDEAEWVVLEPDHRAVEVLLQFERRPRSSVRPLRREGSRLCPAECDEPAVGEISRPRQRAVQHP
ncbi:hypothetical protein [Nonomuraea sp. LPB2021202275-12-8]|uniref:hypothetical protein n=1 Tax=Nonomuraea sp. LPB2021202275-12-8 TaxID=3120159 RepID=UPI00300D3897